MMPKKNTKEMPFDKDTYFKMLDNMLMMPGQTAVQTTGNPYIDRLRMAAQKQRVQLPKSPKV